MTVAVTVKKPRTRTEDFEENKLTDEVGWSSHNLGFRVARTILCAIRELDSIQYMLVNGL